MADRLLSLRVQGFRSIDDLTIPIEGLQVLIGENGAGKSTIVEAFELVRKAAAQQSFIYDLTARHGPFPELLRTGKEVMRLVVHADLDDLPAEYELTLARVGNSPHASIAREVLLIAGVTQLDRSPTRVKFRTDGREKETSIQAEGTALNSLWGIEAPPEVQRFRHLLQTIRVHVPFETKPRWAYVNEQQIPPGIRSMSQLAPIERLDRGGANLASAYQKLTGNPKVWREALLDLQMGLGSDLVTAAVEVKANGGFGELALEFESIGRVPASQLSGGQLSFLAMVALVYLREDDSVVLVDEPETHLHPAVLAALTALLVRLAEQHPVIVTTHADAVLDAVPSEAIRVVVLNGQRAAEIHHLDHARLAKWREEFQSLGTIRREGVLSAVLGAGA